MIRVRRVRTGALAGSARALHRSGADVRRTFLDFFTEREHVAVRSSSVVPLYDPTVPFVNAGMNQFKGIFLGRHSAPHPCVVNSQKCIRVGGKHNDLAVVGADGTHHTLFEMLGNWSFGDYYKKKACLLAWELLTRVYGLRPERLLVTYFGGDESLALPEDRETRDIWRTIGLQSSIIKPLGMADNFWEMGATGPCGPCTEIHHVGADGVPTEIWNLVFIQYNRESDGSMRELPQRHVDTGMGLERMTALLQGVRSNYDTDLFLPIIRAIEKRGGQVAPYRGEFGRAAALDCAYRCLADHARMLSVCLADGMFPSVSLNLKQIMRKSFKLSEDIFHCKSGLLLELYERVTDILGPTYPELYNKMADAKLIIAHEEDTYLRLRSELMRKWKELARQHPEVEGLADVELSGFVEGYRQFKQAMKEANSPTIPAEVVFKLYDTHGFSEDIIDRVAQLNNYRMDREGFHGLLAKHRGKHKSAFKEQAESNKADMFNSAIEILNKKGVTSTNDEPKYNYSIDNGDIKIPLLQTEIAAILNISGNWVDNVEVSDKENFYLVTKDTNFYCEDGGQAEDSGKMFFNEVCFNVISVFKIKDIVFHKGSFERTSIKQVKLGDSVSLQVNSERRLNCMRNHTATHLLNAAIKKVSPNSVTCQIGSRVTEDGLIFNLAVYGQKLSQTVILEAQSLVRRTIGLDARVETAVLDSVQLGDAEGVVTVPGETYPDTRLRVVQLASDHLHSRELCCGTHVPSTRHIVEFCVTSVRGAGGHAPVVHALAGDAASEVHGLTTAALELQQRALATEPRRLREQAAAVRARLARLCGAGSGAPRGEHARCLELLDALHRQTQERDKMSLNAVAEIEMRNMALEADALGRPFIVHFLMCSYLMESANLVTAVTPCRHKPTMVFGCANGIIKVACTVPESCVTKEFTADKWLTCVLPIFKAKIAPSKSEKLETFAAMTGTKVSLINCESQVQEAMKIAIAFAKLHTGKPGERPAGDQYGGIAADTDEQATRGHN